MFLYEQSQHYYLSRSDCESDRFYWYIINYWVYSRRSSTMLFFEDLCAIELIEGIYPFLFKFKKTWLT